MKRRQPVGRGQKTKAIRIDPTGLAEFRVELKANPNWAHYAEAPDSELVRIAIMLSRLHMQPDVFMLTTAAVATLVDEAVRINIAEVARALGAVAQMDRDGVISVTRPEVADAIEKFQAKPVTVPRPSSMLSH